MSFKQENVQNFLRHDVSKAYFAYAFSCLFYVFSVVYYRPANRALASGFICPSVQSLLTIRHRKSVYDTLKIYGEECRSMLLSILVAHSEKNYTRQTTDYSLLNHS